LTVMKGNKGKSRDGRRGEFAPLRDALVRSLDALSNGTFYRLSDFLTHASFGEHNPVLLGHTLEDVRVSRSERVIAPFPEEVEAGAATGREELIGIRLIPFGAVRAGGDDRDGLLIARQRLCDLYFGRELPAGAAPLVADEATRVVVQPDFTVLIIGLNPAP